MTCQNKNSAIGTDFISLERVGFLDKGKPSLHDSIGLLDIQRSGLVAFQFTDSRILSLDNMCSGMFLRRLQRLHLWWTLKQS